MCDHLKTMEANMKIAFPVKEDNGLDSILDEHFGNAGKFMIVDMTSGDITVMDNQKKCTEGSRCKTALIDEALGVDAVVTHCLGDGTRRSMTKAQIKVLQALKPTVKENLELARKNGLKLFHIFDICQTQKNKKEGGCGHH